MSKEESETAMIMDVPTPGYFIGYKYCISSFYFFSEQIIAFFVPLLSILPYLFPIFAFLSILVLAFFFSPPSFPSLLSSLRIPYLIRRFETRFLTSDCRVNIGPRCDAHFNVVNASLTIKFAARWAREMSNPRPNLFIDRSSLHVPIEFRFSIKTFLEHSSPSRKVNHVENTRTHIARTGIFLLALGRPARSLMRTIS